MVRYRVRIRCLLVVVVLYKYWGKLIIRFMTRVELGLPWMWGGDSVGGVRYEGWLEWRAKKSTMKGFSSHCGTRTVLERYTVCFFFLYNILSFMPDPGHDYLSRRCEGMQIILKYSDRNA